MKIELYSVPEDENSKLIKEFLIKNNLKFDEIITNNSNVLSKIAQLKLIKPISLLRVKLAHSIWVDLGFQEHSLNQLIEHIKKYNPKIE